MFLLSKIRFSNPDISRYHKRVELQMTCRTCHSHRLSMVHHYTLESWRGFHNICHSHSFQVLRHPRIPADDWISVGQYKGWLPESTCDSQQNDLSCWESCRACAITTAMISNVSGDLLLRSIDVRKQFMNRKWSPEILYEFARLLPTYTCTYSYIYMYLHICFVWINLWSMHDGVHESRILAAPWGEVVLRSTRVSHPEGWWVRSRHVFSGCRTWKMELHVGSRVWSLGSIRGRIEPPIRNALLVSRWDYARQKAENFVEICRVHLNHLM